MVWILFAAIVVGVMLARRDQRKPSKNTVFFEQTDDERQDGNFQDDLMMFYKGKNQH
jgi:hypothetical protein